MIWYFFLIRETFNVIIDINSFLDKSNTWILSMVLPRNFGLSRFLPCICISLVVAGSRWRLSFHDLTCYCLPFFPLEFTLLFWKIRAELFIPVICRCTRYESSFLELSDVGNLFSLISFTIFRPYVHIVIVRSWIFGHTKQGFLLNWVYHVLQRDIKISFWLFATTSNYGIISGLKSI